MQLCYNPIVKAKGAEVRALANVAAGIASRTVPLFEFDRPSGKMPKYMVDSDTPRIAYLDRAIDLVAGLKWPSAVMVDTFQWPPDARVETGANVVSHVITSLRMRGIPVIPVVGYDRWSDVAYREAIRTVGLGPGGRAAIRLDTFAISDASEPEEFLRVVSDIVEEANIDPSTCSIIIDFADVSGDAESVIEIFDSSCQILELLEDFGFSHYSIVGCSLPDSIDKAVPERDADGTVLRKESIAWQMLRERYPETAIVCGDYCVRGPTTISAPVKHINGKIRYTVDRNYFVVRGHSRINDGGFMQMYDLARRLLASGNYLGPEFSWGDGEIMAAGHNNGEVGPAKWIAIDTNHHVTHVVHEVLQFEQALALRVDAPVRVVEMA